MLLGEVDVKGSRLGEVDVNGRTLGDVEDENTALGVIPPPAPGDATKADPGVIAGDAAPALVYDAGLMGSGGCIVVNACPEYMFYTKPSTFARSFKENIPVGMQNPEAHSAYHSPNYHHLTEPL